MPQQVSSVWHACPNCLSEFARGRQLGRDEAGQHAAEISRIERAVGFDDPQPVSVTIDAVETLAREAEDRLDRVEMFQDHLHAAMTLTGELREVVAAFVDAATLPGRVVTDRTWAQACLLSGRFDQAGGRHHTKLLNVQEFRIPYDATLRWAVDVRNTLETLEADRFSSPSLMGKAVSNAFSVLGVLESENMRPSRVKAVDSDCISFWFLENGNQGTIDCYDSGEITVGWSNSDTICVQSFGWVAQSFLDAVHGLRNHLRSNT